MLAYLSEIDLKEAFRKISERLRLTERKAITPTTKETSELRKEIDELKKLVHGIAALYGDQLVKDAANKLGVTVEDLWMRARSLDEVLEMVADKEWEKQRKAYEKLIEENNNH